MSPPTINDAFEWAIQCNCCSTHQINKPRELVPWIETPFPGPREQGVSKAPGAGCECDCRHRARFFCRDLRDEMEEMEGELTPTGAW